MTEPAVDPPGCARVVLPAVLVRVLRTRAGLELHRLGVLASLVLGLVGLWLEHRAGDALPKAGGAGAALSLVVAGFVLLLPLWQCVAFAFALGLLPRPFRASLEATSQGLGLTLPHEFFSASRSDVVRSSSGVSPWGHALRLELASGESVVLDALMSEQKIEELTRVLSLEPQRASERVASTFALVVWVVFGLGPVLAVGIALAAHRITEGSLLRALLALALTWMVALVFERFEARRAKSA